MASYLLQENGDKITLEDGSGFILLELSTSAVGGESTLDVENMVAVVSENMGSFTALASVDEGSFITVNSLNLEGFMVITDG